MIHRKAIIYRPAKTAMQSGAAKTHEWVLTFTSDDRKSVDPIMGWISSADTSRQLNLFFPTQAAAENYARENGIPYEVRASQERRLKPKSYAANFAHNRRNYSDIAVKSAPQSSTA